MKKLIIITIIIICAFSLTAQNAKSEAMQSLDTAKSLIQQDNYTKAQDEINFALSKISEILAEQLVKYIPDAPAGYAQEEKNAQGLGSLGGFMGSSNAITATARYSGSASAADEDGNVPQLNLTITVGGLIGKAAGFAAMGNMFGGGGTGSKTVRIKGYSATQEYQTDDLNGKLTVQVGEKISVMVEANYITNPDIMKNLVEKMDLAKLEKSF